ncbi:MAG: DUF1566 domain-containing protein [Actinobacteria bacterium]|nr:DUF1566 domain-containing protein [Actinomycetota bacterium]
MSSVPSLMVGSQMIKVRRVAVLLLSVVFSLACFYKSVAHASECGDMIVESEEDCDDGNSSNVDDCLSNCRFPVCGDFTGDGAVTASDALRLLRSAVGEQVDLSCGSQIEICGDVNGSRDTTASDALVVLRGAVGQAVDLTCPVAVCGNGVLGGTEECDGDPPPDQSCKSRGFAGGTLLCGTNCSMDLAHCYSNRFEYRSQNSVLDRQTGLQWKNGSVAEQQTYTWSASGISPNGTLFSSYLAGANSSHYAGYSDWRIPTIGELLVLFQCSPCSPLSLPVGRTWTTAESLEKPDYAFTVWGQEVLGRKKTEVSLGRAVREAQQPQW